MPSSSANRRRLGYRLTAFLAAGLIASCSPAKRPASVVAPNFELRDLSGKTVTLKSFQGSPVLLDFWATWCGPCRMSIPLVQEFYERNKSTGLMVVGLNMDDDMSGVYAFVKKYHLSYPVLFAGASSVPTDYNVEGIPHFVFIDRQGKIVQVYQGFSPEMVQMWETDLQTALREPVPAS